MFVVDTNILIYAADRDSSHHVPCLRLLELSCRGPTPWYLTWGICYEFLRVVTHPRVFRKPWSIGNGRGFLDVLLQSPSLAVLVPGDRHWEIATKTFDELPFVSGNLVHDATTAILMREHGVGRVYTRDADFHRFPFLEVIDPAVGLEG
ncbi:MAG: PIN domain-containing protein [Alphaproteobacteria bacterium]|nr:PIN domain-containing protein [Alphaproteobacteria bacterium]